MEGGGIIMPHPIHCGKQHKNAFGDKIYQSSVGKLTFHRQQNYMDNFIEKATGFLEVFAHDPYS